MITTQFAQEFAQQWVDAWNSHNLDGIMSLCADDIEVTSPFIADLMQEQSGTQGQPTLLNRKFHK